MLAKPMHALMFVRGSSTSATGFNRDNENFRGHSPRILNIQTLLPIFVANLDPEFVCISLNIRLLPMVTVLIMAYACLD